MYLQLLALVLCSFSQSLAQATLIGYIKAFHPDLVEPWGTGISIAQFGDIVISLYFNYFDISQRFSILYLIIGLITVVPMLYCFWKLENLRIRANKWVIKKSFLDQKRNSIDTSRLSNLSNQVMNISKVQKSNQNNQELKFQDNSVRYGTEKKPRRVESLQTITDKSIDYSLFTNNQLTKSNLKQIYFKFSSEIFTAFALQFLNDLMINLILRIHVTT